MTSSSGQNFAYRGRFAPSPSGPLHFGSLVCALASYLDARAHKGQWLLRIEDIDPPREQAGASAQIIDSLHLHGLHHDEEVRFQSRRGEAYRAQLAWLQKRGLSYPCNCTRKRMAGLGGRYDGHCLESPPPTDVPVATRLNLQACNERVQPEKGFIDLIQGEQQSDIYGAGDFVVHRKDGLFAYQLAVVVDDIDQGITHIVRGTDLLDTTHQQRYLFQLWGTQAPEYAHIPVLVDADGRKLSKQNHAKAIDNSRAHTNLCEALGILGYALPANLPAEVNELLAWAAKHWSLEKLPRHSSIPAPSHTMSHEA